VTGWSLVVALSRLVTTGRTASADILSRTLAPSCRKEPLRMDVEQRYKGTQAMAELVARARVRGLWVGLFHEVARPRDVEYGAPHDGLVLVVGRRPVGVRPRVSLPVEPDLATACSTAMRLLEKAAT